MIKPFLFLVLLGWSGFSISQVPHPLPPQSGVVIDKVSNHYLTPQVDSALFVRSLLRPTIYKDYQWNIFSVMESHVDRGDQVSIYAKAFQWGKAPVWAGVYESQCGSVDGDNCYGMEVDLMVPPDTPTNNDRGIALFVGSTSLYGPPDLNRPVHALTGFSVAPFANHPADVEVAFDAQIHCTVACVRVPDGEAVAFSNNGLIVQKFDPQTGYAGWWRKDLNMCVWCVNMSNGDVRRMWVPN